jgi:hypothetical protein
VSRPSSYLLRVRLPDQPGVLGRVATALGNAGADIEGIAVVDRSAAYAVDDIVVALPPGALADRLVSAVAGIPGVVVETVQRHHGRQRIQDDLALLDIALSSDEPLVALVDGLRELMQVRFALVVSGEAAVLAASAGAPEARMRPWLPLADARQVDASDIWDDAAAAGPDSELLGVPFRDGAFVLGRMGGPAFLATEITRVAHLARVAQALLAEGGA